MAAMVLAWPVVGHAQGHGGGPGGGGRQGGGGMEGGGMGGGLARGPFGGARETYGSVPPGARPREDNGGGVQLGPPGRWWDNSRFAQTLGLESRQQRRMDDIFGENKGTLVQLYKNLQREQMQLSKVVRGRELDEAAIFQQIDRVTQARGELEKANAHMLLQIRKEMTPEQAARLDDRRVE